MLVSLPSLSNIAGYNMTRAIRKKSGTGVKTNWHFVWSCSEIDKMITRTDPMIVAYKWYKIGNGESITVDASKMDLNFIDVKKLSKGKSITVQTWNSGLKQGLVYGGITIQYLGNNKIKISPDKYDFYIRPWNSIKEYFRNVETFGAGILHGNGTPFYIHFKGINTVRRKNHLFYKLIL